MFTIHVMMDVVGDRLEFSVFTIHVMMDVVGDRLEFWCSQYM